MNQILEEKSNFRKIFSPKNLAKMYCSPVPREFSFLILGPEYLLEIN